MRKLVEEIRGVLGAGPVDLAAIRRMEQALREAIPRLAETRLCLAPPEPGRYLCHRDQDFGFVVMLMVWGPGSGTPIHDHGTWGVEAILKNALRVTQYQLNGDCPEPLAEAVLQAGAVMHNMPPDRDLHKVEHHAGDSALSLHVYGQDMASNRQYVPGEGFKACSLACSDLRGEVDALIG